MARKGELSDAEKEMQEMYQQSTNKHNKEDKIMDLNGLKKEIKAQEEMIGQTNETQQESEKATDNVQSEIFPEEAKEVRESYKQELNGASDQTAAAQSEILRRIQEQLDKQAQQVTQQANVNKEVMEELIKTRAQLAELQKGLTVGTILKNSKDRTMEDLIKIRDKGLEKTRDVGRRARKFTHDLSLIPAEKREKALLLTQEQIQANITSCKDRIHTMEAWQNEKISRLEKEAKSTDEHFANMQESANKVKEASTVKLNAKIRRIQEKHPNSRRIDRLTAKRDRKAEKAYNKFTNTKVYKDVKAAHDKVYAEIETARKEMIAPEERWRLEKYQQALIRNQQKLDKVREKISGRDEKFQQKEKTRETQQSKENSKGRSMFEKAGQKAKEVKNKAERIAGDECR